MDYYIYLSLQKLQDCQALVPKASSEKLLLLSICFVIDACTLTRPLAWGHED